MQQFGQVSVTSALWSLRKQEPEIAKASDELTNQFRALKSTSVEPCMVVHTYNPSIQEAQTERGHEFKASLGCRDPASKL